MACSKPKFRGTPHLRGQYCSGRHGQNAPRRIPAAFAPRTRLPRGHAFARLRAPNARLFARQSAAHGGRHRRRTLSDKPKLPLCPSGRGRKARHRHSPTDGSAQSAPDHCARRCLSAPLRKGRTQHFTHRCTPALHHRPPAALGPVCASQPRRHGGRK